MQRKRAGMTDASRKPFLTALRLLAAALLATCLHAAAQAPSQPPHNTSAPASTGQQAPAQPAAPHIPAAPVPANEPPTPAQVQWDSLGLHVTASNSSLRQILTEIATRTGAKLDGTAPDDRVFGEYGPGTARDVLAQLLHGTGYNVLLIGDQGQGTPRQIVLTRRTAAPGAKPAGNASQDSDEDSESAAEEPVPEEQPQQPTPPVQPGQHRPPTAERGFPGQPQPPGVAVPAPNNPQPQ